MIGEYYQKENGIIGNGGGNSNKKNHSLIE